MTRKMVEKAILEYSNPKKAVAVGRFFKTGKGQYGAGDIFVGATVPEQRIIAKKFKDLPLSEIEELLNQKIHEFRLTALLILSLQFEKGSADDQKKIYNLYMKNIDKVNNWDLVDQSAPKIVGEYLSKRPKKELCDVLTKLSDSDNLWYNRIAILATYPILKAGNFTHIKLLAKKLMNHPHDLIHKALGWMLREVGKKDEKTLVEFLDKYATEMPRTMLRYSIEKFPEKKRKYYLKMK